MLGPNPNQLVPAVTTVETWHRNSTDESIHKENSRGRWIANRYPIIEAGMSRSDCARRWSGRYDRSRECSACAASFFQTRARWEETKHRWPELFAETVEFDARLRDAQFLQKTPYLYMLRMPLAESVARDEAVLEAAGQADGIGNECEGHCGV